MEPRTSDDPNGSTVARGRRNRLKSAVEPVHAKLDRRISHLFETREGYADYVRATACARSILEGAAARHLGGSHVWPRSGEIAEALVEDLADLGVSAVEVAPVSLTLDLDGQPAACGVVYVLAGSSLGAVHLQKRAQALGFEPHFGARHLARQVHTTRSWLDFVRWLDAMEFSPSEDEECLAGAVCAFETFNRVLATVIDG